MLPRKAAAGAERGSLEPGHASLPGLAGRQLAAGTGGQVPAHRITAFWVRRVTMSSSRAVPDLTARRLFAFFCGQGRLSDRSALRSAPPRSSLPGGLPQDRERRRVVLWGLERLQIRDEQRHIFKRRLLVLLEPEAEPAGGEAAVAVRLFARGQRRELEAPRRWSPAAPLRGRETA